MYPDHIQRLQSARIDAANALHDADARCRALFIDGPAADYDTALAASKIARAALHDAEEELSTALTEWRREGDDAR